MDLEKRHRTIYLLKYTDESGRTKTIWYAKKKQAEEAAKMLKFGSVVCTAKV